MYRSCTPAIGDRIPPVRCQRSASGFPSKNESNHDHAGERGGFCEGKTVLDNLADAKSACVRKCEKRNQKDRDQLFGRKTDGIPGQQDDRCDQIMISRNTWREEAEKPRKCDRNSRDRAGLHDQKQGPAK